MEIQAFTFIRPDAFVDIIVSNETTPSIAAPQKISADTKELKRSHKKEKKGEKKKNKVTLQSCRSDSRIIDRPRTISNNERTC